jgi:hypothetical protein
LDGFIGLPRCERCFQQADMMSLMAASSSPSLSLSA